jgi:UDP-2,3-diacylglucosamine pyrophosphatase LpxH
MDQKRVTLIVSDLHMGDGGKGDDFVDDKNQFATFVDERAKTPEGRDGEIELIINGDFLEFAQVLPEAYTLNSSEFWCSESESLKKLDCILKGHPKVFEALGRFAKLKNRVTLFPGNHDIDLHWKGVQKKISESIPGVNIETQEITYERYGGKLRISHGHLFKTIDPANGFKCWCNPILSQPKDSDPKRLEMCPGTLFVVKFVNFLEAKYPFADNLHPETALAGILAREDRWGLTAVAWMLLRFAKKYPKAFLSSKAQGAAIGKQLLNAIQGDKLLREKIASIYKDVLGQAEMTAAKVKVALASEDAIAAFIERLFQANSPWDDWIKVLGMAKPGVMSSKKSGGGTLSIVAAGNVDVRAGCAEIAEGQWKAGAEIVVLGHTHLTETVSEGTRVYYNPGSWTRYVEDAASLTLEQLKDESHFPYQLNYVRVEVAGGILRSELICIDRFPAKAPNSLSV